MPFPAPTSNKILAMILQGTMPTLPGTLYVSLHTADPADTGANEVSGNGYGRLSDTFSRVDDHNYTNDTDLEFQEMPAVTVSHVGLWDENDVWWWGGPLTDSDGNPITRSVNSGDTLKIPAADLDVTA